jgi:hypothetical protein
MENLRDLFFSGRFNNTFPYDLPNVGKVIEVIEQNGENSFSYIKGTVTHDGEYGISTPRGVIIKSLINDVYREDHEDEIEINNESKWRYPDMYNSQLKHKILQRKIVQRGVPSLKALASRQLTSSEIESIRSHTTALGNPINGPIGGKKRKSRRKQTLRRCLTNF